MATRSDTVPFALDEQTMARLIRVMDFVDNLMRSGVIHRTRPESIPDVDIRTGTLTAPLAPYSLIPAPADEFVKVQENGANELVPTGHVFQNVNIFDWNIPSGARVASVYYGHNEYFVLSADCPASVASKSSLTPTPTPVPELVPTAVPVSITNILSTEQALSDSDEMGRRSIVTGPGADIH